jgi:hypothetical protein
VKNQSKRAVGRNVISQITNYDKENIRNEEKINQLEQGRQT